MEQQFRPVLTIRIFADEKCFGPGIAVQLLMVQELHSQRAAAMSIRKAYSKAWTILKNAQQHLGFQLLYSTTGGKNGGGATLTPEAAALLAAYEEYCSELNPYAKRFLRRNLSRISSRARKTDPGAPFSYAFLQKTVALGE